MTGAASGLGLAIAQAAQEEGATIIALDRVASPFAQHRLCDIADEEQVRHALDGLSRIDTVVNSAGIARRAKVDETDMADFDAVMAVNVRGAFLVAKHALPLMRAAGGSILHLSSGVATTGTRNRAAYSASKGAIVSLTLNMALDYAGDQIRVNCLCPRLRQHAAAGQPDTGAPRQTGGAASAGPAWASPKTSPIWRCS